MERRLAAILLTDMVGYSRLMGLDEEGTIARQRAHRQQVFDPKISSHGGRIVKSTGDGLLVEFLSVVDAVKCAVEVQMELAGRDTDAPEDRLMQYRIGINLGDIVIDGDDILGDGVNVAARLEGLAEPGGVCISGVVYDQLAGKLDIAFEDAGEQTVKNVPRPVQVWHWQPDGAVHRSNDVGTSLLPGKPSIAVLPFDNMSDDPEQEFFADGLAEDIITALTRFPDLLVTARNSSFIYKGKLVDVRKVANELGARYILEGSVRRAGQNIRFTAQLIDATSGNHIWAERYDREFKDVFALQDEITQSIVGSVAPEIGDAEMGRRTQLRGSDTNAYDLALRARGLIRSGFEDDNAEKRSEGVMLAQDAISRDPSCVLAHKCLAEHHRLEIIYASSRPRQQSLKAAKESAESVLLLDRNDPFGFYCLGTAKFYKGSYDDALADLEQSHRLNPTDPFPLMFMSWIKALCGLNTEAIANADLALRLCPRNNVVIGSTNFARSLVAFQKRDYEEAVQTARRSIQAHSAAPMRYGVLAASLIELGKHEEAADAIRQLRAKRPEFLNALFKGDYTVFRNTEENERFVSTVRKAAAHLEE